MIVGNDKNECFSFFRRIWLWFHSNLATNWASVENVSLINTECIFLFGIRNKKRFAFGAMCAQHICSSLFPSHKQTQSKSANKRDSSQSLDESYAIRCAAKIVCVMWNAIVCFSAQFFPFNMLLQAHFVCILMQKRTSTTSARSISIVRFIWPSIFYMAQQPHGLTFASSLLLYRLYIFQNFMYFVQFCLWVSIFSLIVG